VVVSLSPCPPLAWFITILSVKVVPHCGYYPLPTLTVKYGVELGHHLQALVKCLIFKLCFALLCTYLLPDHVDAQDRIIKHFERWIRIRQLLKDDHRYLPFIVAIPIPYTFRVI